MSVGRGPITIIGAVGALSVGIAAQTANAAIGSLGWALAAGVGLTLMLRGAWLRVVGVALAVLACGGIIWAATDGRWVELGGSGLALAAAVGFVLWGPSWTHQTNEGPRASADPWQAMDEGRDPTRPDDNGEQDMPAAGQSR